MSEAIANKISKNTYGYTSDSVELANAYLKQAEQIAELKEKLKQALHLLDAANCPQCGDKSGAYYSNDGEVCQCQWCDEVAQITPPTDKGVDNE